MTHHLEYSEQHKRTLLKRAEAAYRLTQEEAWMIVNIYLGAARRDLSIRRLMEILPDRLVGFIRDSTDIQCMGEIAADILKERQRMAK